MNRYIFQVLCFVFTVLNIILLFLDSNDGSPDVYINMLSVIPALIYSSGSIFPKFREFSGYRFIGFIVTLLSAGVTAYWFIRFFELEDSQQNFVDSAVGNDAIGKLFVTFMDTFIFITSFYVKTSEIIIDF